MTTHHDAAHEGNGNPDVPAGIVLIVDIEGFSRKDAKTQRELVKLLWSEMQKHPLMQNRELERITNSTGDGVLVAFPCLSKAAKEADVIDLASRSIRAMRESEYKIGLRVGIHRGPFNRMKNPVTDQIDAIGTAPNECARVLSLADAGFILVSEEFYKHWRQEDAKVEALFSRSISVHVKHGVEMQVRIYIDPGATQSQGIPSKIRQYIESDWELMQRLGDLERSFIELVSARYASAHPGVEIPTPDRISTRVSFFALRAVQTQSKPQLWLDRTKYRYHRANIQPALGGTSYPVDPDRPGGVLVRSYVKRRPFAINNLPVYRDNPKDYTDRLIMDTSLDRSIVESFGRFARTYIGIPIQGGAQDPYGAVCVDCDDPLSALSTGELEEIGESLRRGYDLTLAILWAQRMK